MVAGEALTWDILGLKGLTVTKRFRYFTVVKAFQGSGSSKFPLLGSALPWA
jgi:hypothetical protein